MPRPVLAKISSNRQERPDLSIANRARIHGRALQGAGVNAIAEAEQLPKTTISTTLKRINTHDGYASNPRTGRYEIASDQDKRAIYRSIRKNIKARFLEIRKDTRCDSSDSTLRRIFQEYELDHWHCISRLRARTLIETG